MLEGDDYTDNVLKGGGGDDVLQGHAGADTLDGGDGNDTAIYGGSTAGVTVFLSSGVGHGGDAEGDHLYNIENLRGSNYDDTFWGDENANVLEGLAGKDQLKGAGGADTLIGGMGADVMTGGAGGDAFVWESIAETGIASSDMDTIKDFNAAEGDKINLHAIDANTTIAGNQDFTFIETANFSAPGQIRYFNDGVDTYIVMNRDSVLVDDAAIRISGVHTVDASWFVL
jgi:Ca2+-binding RTX toxin-like protein